MQRAFPHRACATPALRAVAAVLLLLGASAALHGPGPAAASPVAAAGTLTLANDAAHPIVWSGGPLYGGNPADSLPPDRVADMSHCGDIGSPLATISNCQSVLLDVQLTHPDNGQIPFLRLELNVDPSCALELYVYEPWASSLATDHERIGCNGPTLATFLAPQSGTWRVVAYCYACLAQTYSWQAHAGLAERPQGPRPMGSPHFDEVRLVGSGGLQPKLAMDAEGRAFVEVGATPAGATVWRATASGSERVSNLRGGDNGDLAVGPDGTVYAKSEDQRFAALISVSRDHGVTFQSGGTFGADAHDGSLAAGPGGLVYGVAIPIADGPRIEFWRSTDHGQNFTPRSDLSLFRPESYCGHPDRPLVDPRDPTGNTVYVVYRDITPGVVDECDNPSRDWRTQIWIARTTDGGITWNHTQVKQTDGILVTNHGLLASEMRSFASAIAPDGHLYVTWSELANPCANANGPCMVPQPCDVDPGLCPLAPVCPLASNTTALAVCALAPNNATSVWMARSFSNGTTWDGPFRVDQRPAMETNAMPRISAPGNGRVDFAWYSSNASNIQDPQAMWGVAFARSTDADSAAPTFSEAMVTNRIVHAGGCVAWCAHLTGLEVVVGPDGKARLAWAVSLEGGILDFLGTESDGE